MQPVTTPSPRSLGVAALAAIGAGAIHAVAAGAHSDHRQAVWLFTALAATQLAWGVAALRRPDDRLAGAGAALSLGAIVGWLAAKTVGIGFVDGMAAAEPLQAADGIAAALATVTLAGCLARLLSMGPVPRPAVSAIAALVVAASLPGMAAAGTHAHADSDHGHGAELIAGEGGHGHDAAEGDTGHDDVHEADVDHRPYDPALPIRLAGMPGTTPQQVAEAERLVAITLERLPRFADPAVAEEAGFRSIGDGFTGHEHFVNWGWLDDGRVLDPDHPESLVYEVVDGERTLVAAMYMLEQGATLDDIPDIGGPLIQWHVHEDLCYTRDAEAPRVAGLTLPDGSCPPHLMEGPRVPMIHVWITPHPCGPFASLEGVAGGTIPEGEERLCDHVHGSR